MDQGSYLEHFTYRRDRKDAARSRQSKIENEYSSTQRRKSASFDVFQDQINTLPSWNTKNYGSNRNLQREQHLRRKRCRPCRAGGDGFNLHQLLPDSLRHLIKLSAVCFADDHSLEVAPAYKTKGFRTRHERYSIIRKMLLRAFFRIKCAPAGRSSLVI